MTNSAGILRSDRRPRGIDLTSCVLGAGLVSVGAVTGLHAQTFESPSLKVGDTWTYRSTMEQGTAWNERSDDMTVDRLTSTAIYYSQKPSGSSRAAQQAMAGTDWSRIRDVNGKEVVVNRPLAFPLSIGKHWEVTYEEMQPNKAHKSERWDHRCAVLRTEPIEVPAGKFNALKIECEGKWTAELEPTQTIVLGTQGGNTSSQAQKTAARTATGRTYKAFWYVPAVRRWVKSVEEYYNSNGIRTQRFTEELQSYKVKDEDQ